MESQKHGFLWEEILKKNIFQIKDKINYTSKYDIPSDFNKINNKNISIKSSNCNTICCGDPFRYINDKNENLETIIILYKQEDNKKVLKRIIILNTIIIIKLLNEISLEKLLKLNNYIKNIKKNIKITNEIRGEYMKFTKELNTDLLNLNPKVDSKTQRRLQFTIKIDKIIKEYPKYIIYQNEKPIIYNISFQNYIISCKRSRNKRDINDLNSYPICDLIQKCRDNNIKGYSKKKKLDLILLLNKNNIFIY